VAVRLLSRLARGKPAEQPTEEELGELALGFINIDATREGLRILDSLDSARVPRFLSFQAQALFRRWDWAAAIPRLERALRRPEACPLDRLRATLHLATAVLNGLDDRPRARELLMGLLAETGPARYRRLFWDAHGLLLQLALLETDVPAARQHLEAIEGVYVPDVASALTWTARMWRALVEFKAGGTREQLAASLDEARAAFGQLELWENVRTCDYQQAIATRDLRLLHKLFYGSPYPGLRRALLKAFGPAAGELPPTCVLSLPEASSPEHAGVASLELLTGRNSCGTTRLKPGQSLQRLLAALAADLYVRPNVSQLFERIYPEEHYNPLSGPLRVRQLLKRLRQWLRAGGIPLHIEERRGRYRLRGAPAIRLVAALSPDEMREHARVSEKLREVIPLARQRFGAGTFKADELASLLGVSRATVLRLLGLARSRKLIELLGASSARQYRLLEEPGI
jgi:hypothetical protein